MGRIQVLQREITDYEETKDNLQKANTEKTATIRRYVINNLN